MKRALTLLAIFFLTAAPLVSVAQKFPGLDEKNATLEPQAEPAPSQQTPSSQQAQQANQPASQAQQNGSNSYSFTPLTNLPGINEAARSETLPAFFSSIYKLCIGAAAVIAILQIMRAGGYFMFNKGSIAHNEKGKSLIMNSILGLLLVLSPAIVFGIINPDILDLRLDLERLSPRQLTPVDLSSGSADSLQQECNLTQTIGAETRRCWDTRNANLSTAYNRCLSDGTAAQTCRSQAEAAARTAVSACLGQLTNEQTTCVVSRSINYAESQRTSSTPGGSRATGPVPADQEYEWRQRYLEGQTLRGVHGRRFPNQQECTAHYQNFLREHPTWLQDGEYEGCNCTQPRSAFPACRN